MLVAQLLFKPHLEDGEKIIYVAHKHIFTSLKKIIRVIFLGFVVPGIFLVLMPVAPFTYIIYGIMGLGFLKFLYVTADWYFDAWLITNLSIIQVVWNGFFDRTEMRIEYHAVKGVSYKIQGVLGTLFNYGEIYIEIYAANTLFTLEHAIYPKKIQRAVLNSQQNFIEKKSYQDHETLKEMLSTMIQTQTEFKNRQ